jgi:hypothetical protein
MLYLPGLKNVVADFLSRPSPPEPTGNVASAAAADPVDFEVMAAEQNSCAETQRLLCGTSLKLAFLQAGAHRLAGDVSTGVFRPIVQQKFRQDIFLNSHNISHPGRLASRCLVSSRFVWRGLSSDITAWTRSCLCCQQGKIHRHVRLQPLPIPIPQHRFSHIHIDLVGPLQSSYNCLHILTVIDHTSKWMEAIPLVETFAAACAKALTFSWISRFGAPETITSVGRNLPQTSGLSFARCYTSRIAKRPLTTLSRTARSKDCTAASRTRSAHAPPRQLGPMSYLLYSLDFEPTRGKTLVFPQLNLFMEPQLSYPMNFYSVMSLLLILL